MAARDLLDGRPTSGMETAASLAGWLLAGVAAGLIGAVGVLVGLAVDQWRGTRGA